jgi:hypothetical protein
MSVKDPLVTIITATTGNPLLENCLCSVHHQTYSNIQHLVTIDGAEKSSDAYHSLKASGVLNSKNRRVDVIELPYSTGKDRWNGHRIYGASTYFAEGDYVLFLDDDNTLLPHHVESCIHAIQKGYQWVFALRNIVDKHQQIVCEDNCESLGKWPSILHPEDYFVDVNCYFLPRLLAIQISPFWFRKFREPGQAEVDRVICHALRQIAPHYESTYEYSVNYLAGNSTLSVQAEFFIEGNTRMLEKHSGILPWK